jgi:hypothetical protein
MRLKPSIEIACLAWGSLVWDPRTLKANFPWKDDGPVLPVEYVRQSRAKHLTLVLTDKGAPVATLWTTLRVESLPDAVESLRFREGERLDEKHIGRWPSERGYPFSAAISTWAVEKNLDAVVWTALPPKFANVDSRIPTAKEALKCLSDLQGEALATAETYVRRTPHAIRTPFRALFETELGWFPL